MALEPTHVTVAGTGAVYVAPEGTALPVDLAEPPAPFVDVGFVGEDGCSFTFSRDQEEINAWQSAEPVRVLITSEPKTIEFELLEFDRDSLLLAFRGGSFAGAAAPYTYTPPDPGVSDVRAMVIDGKDGAQTFRFCFPRVQLQGDLEFALLRTDAVRLAMEFGVLASTTKWSIVSDLPGFGAGALLLAGETALPRTHADLDAAAAAAGYSWSRADLTIAEKQAELEAATAAPVAG
ncbi:MAG TPA: hypothetical protein VKB54_07095 [Solirubrobacteraceae bacterium]|nr:hypothetical protein [Solirubrobacteraceae bacterium]